MPARDSFHGLVREAQVREGWTITGDPVTLIYGTKALFVDLGAQHLIGASCEGRRIAVEVKSFRGLSEMADLEMALGQFVLYRAILRRKDPACKLYLAIPIDPHQSIFMDPLGEMLLQDERLALIVFDPSTAEIIRWID